MEEDSEDDIAVVGIGCNFPGGETLDRFWRVLLEGRNCVVDIPAERFDTSLWYDADSRKAGKTQTTKAALIEGFNEIDHKFFGITEAEADFMDPQQKLLLQCTYRALEDAGMAMESISGSRTGVYIGLMNRDYEMLRSNSPTETTHYSATGTAMSVAANRISFTFNLTGPSLALDSACSSSLVAVHLACQAIKQGDCEMALCGGVSCIIEPRVFVALSKAKMISPEGTSKPFSSRADGYGRGEGCGVVLLKPLKKATRDYNNIWGIISKSAVNQDGRSVSPITKPSMVQQEELLRRLYSASDLAHVQYIEAHGTGTPAGDPTEAGSISNAIAKARPSGSETLRIGSVKGNIGHTESAAGVAGLIKVLLMMKHRTIVPSVFYSEDSTGIDVKALSIKIPTEAEGWETSGSVERVAGINSFGFGGTNAHVIVREHRAPIIDQIPKGCPKMFVISAASETSFRLTITDTLQRLPILHTVDFQAMSYTSACGRTHSRHKYRKAFLTSSLSDLQHQLTPFLKTKVESCKPDIQVVFVFCGNGVAYRGMCRQLLREVPVFRDAVRVVDKQFQRHNTGLYKWLAGECEADFSKPDVVQPLLFAVQVGIASVLRTWGISPDAVLGHSVGEVAAAHCSGLLSLEDAVKVLYHRSSLQSKVTGGKMLVVSNVAVEKILDVLQVFSGQICVAAFNSPRSCTLSGDGDAIDLLHERLKSVFTDENLFLRALDVPVAYHSHWMDPIIDDVERSIGRLDANTMQCKLLSTVTGDWCSEGDFCTGAYWAKNIREPVVFEQTLRAATKDKQSVRNVVFVEVGPRRALQRNICETLGSDACVLGSAQPQGDCDALLSAAGRLFELGINVHWHQVYRGYETVPTAFPVYQFETSKKSLNFEDVRRADESFAFPPLMLISPKGHSSKDCAYVCNLALETAPYLWEHKNNGVSILPGAFYVDLAYASVIASLNKPPSLLQLSVTFKSLFTLTSKCHQLKVTLEHEENVGIFKIQSHAATHASGTYVYSDCQALLEEPRICVDTISQRCKLLMKRKEIYSILSQAGFEYGSVFKQLHHVSFGVEFKEAVTKVHVLGELLQHLHDYFIHPVLLDYFLQMTAVVAVGQLTVKQGFPSAIGSISISGPLQEKMILYLRATQDTPDFLEVCGCFSTTEGKVLVELKGVRISFLGNCSNVSQLFFFHNEITAIKNGSDLNNCKIKAMVFEDRLGIAEGLRPHIHPESITVGNTDCWRPEKLHELVYRSLDTNIQFTDVIFIWAVEDLRHLSSEKMLDCLVTSCEIFRQIVLALKKSKRACTVRVITYRTTEMSVDHINAGSVLAGMTRACAAEMPGLSFQLIDLASVTREDISTLVRVLNTCKKQEVIISKGQACATRIARTPVKDVAPCEGGMQSCLSSCVLQTTDPYKMAQLSAVPCDANRKAVEGKSVEIQLTNLCSHSSDFFPVTTSHLNFGQTMYWDKHASKNHSLLALDFSGIVTAVGKDVRNLRVGDHIAACYPVPAAANVRIPEAACYCTRSLPFLEETPCVSFYIVAWEILQLTQPLGKQPHAKLVIISSSPAAAMIKVLALAANRSGWNVSTLLHFKGEQIHLDQGDVFVFLPPFDHSWQLTHDHRDIHRQVIFVCGDRSSSTLPANTLLLQSDHAHVHKLDVHQILQKANLRAQKRKILKWMMSLGFESASLPLKKKVFQLSSTTGLQTDAGSESYFTTATVQQVVLRHGGSDGSGCEVPLLAHPGQLFKRGCVYVVTGGLSGLGLETVKFIAHNGGGCIATLSRSAPTNEAHFEMELLQRRYGVATANIQCDVSVSKQVVDAVSDIEHRFSCSIKGVFHSAAVLHDALIDALDEAAFRKVLRPKVSGAVNLHYATLHSQLDFFVCYSSISSFIGNASQCNYAAANSFLDTFCHYRRNQGLAGQAINWGPLNLGLLLNKGHFQKFLEAKGMKILDVCEVHEALKMCLWMNRAQQVICKFNFQNLNIHVLSQNASLRERLSPLVEAELKGDVGVEPGFQSLASAQETVKTIVSDISNVGVDELDGDSALGELGIDSMLAMTLQNKIFQETGVNVPLVRILDPSSTLSTVVTFVLNNGN